MPKEVQRELGHALRAAQMGDMPPNAKPLRGLGSGVFEIALTFQKGAFRAAYVVRFRHSVYVLHVFQKKSKSGIATPKPDIDLIRERLRYVENVEAHG